MEVAVRHNPGFAVARVQLAPGEECRAESGAMMATSGGVEVEAKVQGGFMKSLKRSVLSGESFFMTTFRAGERGGFVDCAAKLPGDVTVFDASHGIALTRGSYLCSAASVEIDTSWGGFKNMWGGEGGFLVRAIGEGPVVAACYGALDTIDVPAGDSFVLDSGHLVGYSAGMTFTTRKVTKGIVQTLKSGEGLVMDFQGPGRIYAQAQPARVHRLADRRAAVLAGLARRQVLLQVLRRVPRGAHEHAVVARPRVLAIHDVRTAGA